MLLSLLRSPHAIVKGIMQVRDAQKWIFDFVCKAFKWNQAKARQDYRQSDFNWNWKRQDSGKGIEWGNDLPRLVSTFRN